MTLVPRTLAFGTGAVITGTVLLFPFVVLILNSSSLAPLPAGEMARVFGFTALQAALSALVSCATGVAGGFGLTASAIAFGSKRKKVGRILGALTILPNVVPTLLVILATMSLFPFVQGLWGIVVVHALLNTGVVAVAFSRLLVTRIGGMAELAWIEGAGRLRFIKDCVLPLLARDILRMFLFVFALSFSSFAVPLILGGSRATTVEVWIFQAMQESAGSGAALSLALWQSGAMLVATWLLLATESKRDRVSSREGVVGKEPRAHLATPLTGWLPGLAFAFAPVMVIISGLLEKLPEGMSRLGAMPELYRELPARAAGSLIVGLCTGLLTMSILFIIAAAPLEGFFRRMFLGIVAPGPALMGFALLLVWQGTGIASLMKISFGLALATLPALYRLLWDGRLGALRGQIAVARTLGASHALVFREVVVPRLWGTGCFLGGLASFWAWGDFALSTVVAERDLTLAMTAASLMSTYRLEAATAVSWLVVLGGTFNLFIFLGAGRVFGARFET